MAAKTLLDGVNEVLKRVNLIDTDQGTLTTLTDSARQHPIDVAVQVINEGIDSLFSYSDVGLPKDQGESTFTLATGTREYALASDLARLHFPIVDRTNTQYITPFPGGYDQMLLFDVNQNFTGLPYYAEISPITGLLRVERAPTATENGRVYTYEYEKDTVLAAATDAMPFESNNVFRSMVPAWVQLWKREMQNQFDQALYMDAVGRASRYLTAREPRTSWSPRGSTAMGYDPFVQ